MSEQQGVSPASAGGAPAPDEPWNAAAICQALCCPGCPDCRDDDSDATWDGKDEEPEDTFGHSWVCSDLSCPNEFAFAAPGTCTCGAELIEIDNDGNVVQP